MDHVGTAATAAAAVAACYVLLLPVLNGALRTAVTLRYQNAQNNSRVS